MAKTKKDIDAFKKAMLLNTKVIGSDSKTSQPEIENAGNSQSAPNQIPQDILNKYEALAEELNINASQAIELALDHFLELKTFLKIDE